MARNLLSITVMLTLAMSGISRAAVLSDDPTTFGLWHVDTAASSVTPDDTSVTGRPANNMSMNEGISGYAATITTGGGGVYGEALNFGTAGKTMCRASNWPTGPEEFKLDGWFYIPSVACLPISTSYGGSGAATEYIFFISGANDTNRTVRLYIFPNSGVPSCKLNAVYYYTGGSNQVCSVTVYDSAATPPVDMTAKWLHIVTYSQYDAGATDPDYNRAVLSVDDGTTVVESVKMPSGQLTQTAGKSVFIGQMSGNLDKTPYRGFRGKIDELKISKMVNLPRTAEVPSPTNGSSGYTYSPPLSWTPGLGAQRSEVYFGTDQAAVASAQRLQADINADRKVDLSDVNDLVLQWLGAPVMPCPDLNYDDIVNFVDFATMAGDYNSASTPLFLGSTTGNAFDAGEMLSNTTYYWRVDSADCNGVVPGTVWSFTTASAKAGVPVPANNSTGVTYQIDKVALSWAKGFAGSSYQVYFGTSAVSLTWLGDTAGNTMYSPEGVQQNTQYYWRVDTLAPGGTVTGDTWTFKTGVISFPGAEGFGRWAKGGRGGDVYHVTSLARTGAGTLRDAIDTATGPRTIVFDVSGYIDIHGTFGINKSNLTIAGQTSPGGIGISGDVVNITGASDIVMRYMRLRHGDREWGSDCMDMTSSAKNVMLDHLSMQYSTDENWSLDNPQNVTLQWSINAWGLQDHSCGGLVYTKDVTVHHTLWAHNHTRNPKHRNGLMDWVNNVVFDWDIPYICADADSDTHWANVVGGYFISAGGSTDVFTSAQMDRNTGLPTYHMYLYNTLTDLNNNGIVDGIDRGTSLNGGIDYRPTRYAAPQVTTDSPTLAYKRIVSSCGAVQPLRDDVDAVLMNDVVTQNRRIISNESETGASNAGMGTFGTAPVPADTDQDGMPDYWEVAMGLNAAVADNNGDLNGDGYTNLEDYLNWLGGPHTQVTAGGYVDVDLRQFTSGFALTASYTIAGATGGTATILGDGHTARFTSTGGIGMASFSYTVNDGSVFTDTVQVLVLTP